MNGIAAASLAMIGLVLSQNAVANAFTVSGAHVAAIDGTHSPSNIVFTVDTPAGSCAAGAALTFAAVGSNDVQKSASASAVMSSLLTAKASGGTVTFGGDDVNCQVLYLQSR